MNRRFLSLLLLLIAGLALWFTSRWWLPWLLDQLPRIEANADLIQAIEALVNIVWLLFSAVIGYLLWLSRPGAKPQADRRVIALDAKFAYPHHGLGNVYSDLGRHDEAIAAYQQAIALGAKYALLQMSLASIYRKRGDNAAYQQQVALAQPFIAKENEYNRACFASICGDVDEALALLEAAIAKAPGNRITAQRDPDFDFIRDEPRFQALTEA